MVNKLKIVVAGLIGSFPMAGSSLSWFQYVLGLRQLGHDVLYLEDTGNWYYDPFADKVVEDSTLAIGHVARLMKLHDLSESWTFVDHAGQEHGLSGRRLQDFIEDADLLVHVTGAMYLHDRYLQIPKRAYVDTDPGFIQLRLAQGSERDKNHLERHNVYFSLARNIGQAYCTIPTMAFEWHPTVQPIFMPMWPRASRPPKDAAFTTIVKWDASGHGPLVEGEDTYGLKDVEFVKFVDLPQMVDQSLELATAGIPPVADLPQRGWKIRSGPDVSSSIAKYQQYIHESLGEWSIAKNCYVRTRGGWFSDRSASYLASGRPVVVQSTGFEHWLPTGAGVLGFTTPTEAAAALSNVVDNYEGHCRAAREIADEYFDSAKVLRHLVDTSMSC